MPDPKRPVIYDIGPDSGSVEFAKHVLHSMKPEAVWILVRYLPGYGPQRVIPGNVLLDSCRLPKELRALREGAQLTVSTLRNDDFEWSNMFREETGPVAAMREAFAVVQKFRERITGWAATALTELRVAWPNLPTPKAKEQTVYVIGLEDVEATIGQVSIVEYMSRIMPAIVGKGFINIPVGPIVDRKVRREVVLFRSDLTWKEDEGKGPDSPRFLEVQCLKGFIPPESLQQFTVDRTYFADPLLAHAAEREDRMIGFLNEAVAMMRTLET